MTGLANGQTHGVLLRALAGSRIYCFDKLIFVTPSDPALRPPTGISAARVEGTSRYVILAWDHPGDSSLSYEYMYIAVDHAPDRGWTPVTPTAAGGRLTAAIEVSQCGQQHQFRVRTTRNGTIDPHSVW